MKRMLDDAKNSAECPSRQYFEVEGRKKNRLFEFRLDEYWSITMPQSPAFLRPSEPSSACHHFFLHNRNWEMCSTVPSFKILCQLPFIPTETETSSGLVSRYIIVLTKVLDPGFGSDIFPKLCL